MNLLILGANSDIAQEIARRFASRKKGDIFLASRNLHDLDKQARDLSIRYGIHCEALFFDALDYTSHAGFYESLDPKPDIVIVSFGLLGNQETAQANFQEAKDIIETNYLGVVSILEIVASDFERRRNGFIIAIGSVAGIRGRKSNYMYGSAKGGMEVYLGGLRNRLHHCGVRVMTVLPGFVRTKMTEGMQLPGFVSAEPTDVAADIYRAYEKNKDVVYSKWFWKWIMAGIRWIPEFIFKRLKL